ncbi:hypothetical protein GETHLI_18820 [Geothrix limicola]|uniref:Uncharacterized protein n=1 Tax=Geothrix limicola TaxID=2927978 RepID=A0ABQ5QG63_9BACT|nr:hypothetical protein [Geothrix limicola]GLH73380.1 hypothetical protein GETHLI_18820 [Geothrix limicola]
MRISHLTLVTAALALSPLTALNLPGIFQHAVTMTVSPDIPAAQGKVKFNKTDDGNVSINLEVKYLADPQKLQPPATTYVVWVSADKDSPAQNIGALKVDKDREGTLKSVTPLHAFQLFVTAEANGQIQTPAGTRLLWTEYNSN